MSEEDLNAHILERVEITHQLVKVDKFQEENIDELDQAKELPQNQAIKHFCRSLSNKEKAL